MNLEVRIGDKLGMLTVKAIDGRYYECECDCGKTIRIRKDHLLDRRTLNCGNHRQKSLTMEGSKRTRLFGVWIDMRTRCYNKNNKNYCLYGGRGILVCDDWLGSNGFKNFHQWAYANGYREEVTKRNNVTLDRINPDDGYNPNNCRWVSMKVQNNNRRNNHRITIDGETHNLTEWSRIKNISQSLISARINRLGWSEERAVLTPAR